MNYLQWNDLIVKHFFKEAKAGREVLLYVNDEIIDSIGEPYGIGVDDFIESVKKGPDWTTHTGFCQKALQACEAWRDRGFEYPPYVSYLAFFVLAAVTETDYAPHSYYPRFWKRLGESQDSGRPPSFDYMITLWDDLEKWSREDKHEELGRFVARIRGGYMHVGLPRSQTVLSEHERKLLLKLFYETGLDPTDTPSPTVIPKMLKCYGQDILENRTLKLLDSTQADDAVLLKALVEVVLDELEEWDGTFQYQIVKEEPSRLHVHTGLRLCVKLDLLAASSSVYVRFKTSRMFPEDGLHFKRKHDVSVWFCREAHQGWSTPLKDIISEPPVKLNGTALDWNDGVQFVDGENHWRARLRGAKARLFRKGIDGLPDWVETQKLERGMEFLVACSRELNEKVKEWGSKNCKRFEHRQVSGLPSEWVLYYGKNASNSCPGIDILSVSTTARLVLTEGIKSGKRNVYFKFTPPKVVVENSSGSEKVTMNGVRLRQPDVRIPVWVLPDNVPVDQPLRIEVDLGEHRLSKVIRLEEFGLPLSFDEIPCRDGKGEICASDISVRVSGAVVYGEREIIEYPGIISTHLSDRIIFLGGRPGEVADWPSESVPSSWQPVWAVVKRGRKRWDVYFCGKPEHLRRGCSCPEPVGGRSCIRRWKEALWIRRKRTVPPQIRDVRLIWEDYVRVARNV